MEFNKNTAVHCLIFLYAYHNGYLNFIFGEPSKAGQKKS